MTHHHHVPEFPLNQFIAGFTYYKDYQAQHRVDRFLPNGNTEVIIDFTGETKHIYDNETLRPIQDCKKVWISGIRNHFITIPSGADAEMFIIEFKKGMAHPFLGRPLTEITDRVIDADLVLNPVFTELRERLLAEPTTVGMFATAEGILYNHFRPRLAVNPFVDFAVNRMLADPRNATIAAIAAKTGYSGKHFIKIFASQVGVNPKAFLRIIRFQKAIAEIGQHGNINWAALALECGYYDQAHFIAHFKAFTGFTPVNYMRQRTGEFTDYIAIG